MLQLQHPSVKRRRPIRSRDDLAEHLQWALAVELSTIPPYLCAMYSLQDAESGARQLLRGVVIEEMLHLMLVCNLRNAVGPTATQGAHPSVVDVAARYPTFIPHHAAGGPFVQLQAASVAQVRTVFMGIEQPEPTHAPPQGDHFATIGQLYEAIAEGIRWLAAQPEPLFQGDPALQQRASYFGGGGGRLVPVTDVAGALVAIREIVAQGEGAQRGAPPRPGDEPFGALDNYGLRDDGTIGPIVGGRWEASHYSKFDAIASGQVPLGEVWPMGPNPDTRSLRGPLRRLSALFDDVYGLLLRAIDVAVSEPSANGPFFSTVLPLMHTALPQLAGALMQTPLHDGADPSVGPNAGPAFLVGDAPLAEVIRDCDALVSSSAVSPDVRHREVWLPALLATQAVLAALPS